MHSLENIVAGKQRRFFVAQRYAYYLHASTRLARFEQVWCYPQWLSFKLNFRQADP